MTTVGLLHPGPSAEDDYPRIEMLLNTDVRLQAVRTDFTEDAIAGDGYAGDGKAGDGGHIEALRRMGAAEKLAEHVEELLLSGAESIVWACTSGSCVYGWEGAHQQTRILARAGGLPASSTSFAFAHALRALGIGRVAVASTYPQDVTSCFTDFLTAGGAEVVNAPTRDTVTADEAKAWEAGQVQALTLAADHPDAEAVLIPATGLLTAAQLPELEEAVGKPVLTATQVTVWEGLRLAERRVRAPKLGTLFAGRE